MLRGMSWLNNPAAAATKDPGVDEISVNGGLYQQAGERCRGMPQLPEHFKCSRTSSADHPQCCMSPCVPALAQLRSAQLFLQI